MASLPKPPKWIEELRGSRIISEVTGCELHEAAKALNDALCDGDIRARRKIGISDAVELMPEYWGDEQRVRDDRNNRIKFEIHHGDLMDWLSPAKKKSPTKQGRPPKWDWEAFWVWAVLLNGSEGLPDKQSVFVEMAQLWFQEHQGSEPSESLIKEKAGPLYRAMAGK